MALTLTDFIGHLETALAESTPRDGASQLDKDEHAEGTALLEALRGRQDAQRIALNDYQTVIKPRCQSAMVASAFIQTWSTHLNGGHSVSPKLEATLDWSASQKHPDFKDIQINYSALYDIVHNSMPKTAANLHDTAAVLRNHLAESSSENEAYGIEMVTLPR